MVDGFLNKQKKSMQFTVFTVLNEFITPSHNTSNVRFMQHLTEINSTGNYPNHYLCFCNINPQVCTISLIKITGLILKCDYCCYPSMFKCTILQKGRKKQQHTLLQSNYSYLLGLTHFQCVTSNLCIKMWIQFLISESEYFVSPRGNYVITVAPRTIINKLMY